jgi:hypothetical protein
MQTNVNKIVEYIEENILTHIDYMYETPMFGPFLHIGLNGPYSKKIRFYRGDMQCDLDNLATQYPDETVQLLNHWQDAKAYLNTEISNKNEIIKLINDFEV